MSEEILDRNIEDPKSESGFTEKANDLITNGYETDVMSYIGDAWQIVKSNMGMFIGYALLYTLGSVIVSFIPFIGSLAFNVISPALAVGFAIVAKKIKYNEDYEFKNFFDGFQNFGQLFVLGLIGGLLTLVGMMFFVIPGIYLAVAYSFGSFIVVFAGKEFWGSLEFSRKIISKKWFNFFGFGMLLFLINILGMLCLGIGLFVTWPLSAVAMWVAYDRIIGSNVRD
jgi:uncharacterized membrane protein